MRNFNKKMKKLLVKMEKMNDEQLDKFLEEGKERAANVLKRHYFEFNEEEEKFDKKV